MTTRFFEIQKNRARKLSLGFAASLMAFGLVGAGCDTIAQISFPERTFQSVRPVSLNPTGSIVNNPGEVCRDFNGNATLRTVLQDNRGGPIKAGEAISFQDVDLRTSDVRFSSERYYSFPNQACESNDDCDGPLVCADTPNAEIGRRCQMSRSVSVRSTPRFVADEPATQAIAVVMSQEGRLRGWLPSDVGSLFIVDENGVQIGGQDRSINTGRAIDNGRDRFGALRQLRSDFQNLETLTRSDNRSAFFSLWSFGESSADRISWTDQVGGGTGEDIWTRQAARFSSAVDAFDQDPAAARADVYSSVNAILNDAFAAGTVGGQAEVKTLVLIVGGHDERRRQNLTVDTVIESARDLGVRVHVIHAENSVDVNTLRDDYLYYQDQAPCGDDSDCKNFEECRQPTLLCQSSGSTCSGVTHPATFNANPNVTYCLPKRDENGRVGPIQDYQRLACETGGGYSYLPAMTNSLLYSRMNGLAMDSEGAWEVDIVLDDAIDLPPGEAYGLESILEVSVNQTTRSYNFSSAGISGVTGRPYSRDTRAVFFTPAD